MILRVVCVWQNDGSNHKSGLSAEVTEAMSPTGVSVGLILTKRLAMCTRMICMPPHADMGSNKLPECRTWKPSLLASCSLF